MISVMPSLPSEIQLLSTLFDNLPLGLVVLDPQGNVVVYNRAEAKMAARSQDRVMGTSFFDDIAPCMDVRELGGVFRDKIGRESFDVTVDMSFPFPMNAQPRDVKVRLASFEVGRRTYGFLMIEDVSLMRAVDRMREQLQSLLVHDLKNPLAAISMSLELLTDFASVRDTPDAMESIEHALAATKRLNRMTVNLLDISRLETATMPLRRTRVGVASMLHRVVNDNLATARMTGTRLHVAAAADLDAELDEDLTVRALDNLVENALRHARTVTLSAIGMPGRLTIQVTDDGPGVPKALRERLFDKYVQVGEQRDAARGQNRGLGLTFVRLVAQQHGGDVDLACPPGGGTVFTLRLALPASP